MMSLCLNCEEHPAYARGLCNACYRWSRRHEEPRPKCVTKLTPGDVVEIAIDYVNGDSSIDLADQYGVSVSTITSALTGRTVTYRAALEGIPQEYLKALLAYRGRFGPRKLTPAQVRKIRAAHHRGVTQRELVEVYKVCKTTISNLVRGLAYAEVSGPIAGKYQTQRAAVAAKGSA